MISAWYHLLLNKIKQIPDPNLENDDAFSKEIVDFGEKIKGVYQHRLRFWFGPNVSLYKTPIPMEYGRIVHDELDFDPDDVTMVWSKPTSKEIYVLEVEGTRGGRLIDNAEQLGFTVEPGPKLFKRLKRAFGVMTVGSTSQFTHRIIEEEDKAPEKVTDGMAFAKSSFISHRVRRAVRQGECFQYSMLGPFGLTKGTVVAMDHLDHDVVVPGLHNVKTELRSHGKKLFCIEGYEDPKQGRTDIQTLINMGNLHDFEAGFDAAIDEVIEVAANHDAAAKWYWEEFESQDWYTKELDKYLRRKDHDPHAKMPPLESKPVLTAAHEMGIDVRVSPTLHKSLVRWIAGRINIDKLKVPVENSCRGYIIPDLSQFDPVTAEFTPNKDTVLRANQIAFPEDMLPEGPVAVVRQPNGVGEALVTNNVKANVKSRGVQISPLAACPSMAKYYDDMPTLGFSWLERAGGADYDDSVIGFANPETVTVAHKRLQEIEELDLPPSNMEDIVDAAVQNNEFPWTVNGQLLAGVMKQEMDLGAAVNFMMALTLVEDWEFYRFAAASTNAAELADAQEQYLKEVEYPRYPDCWLPEEPNERDKYARLPIESWDPFEYYAAEEVETDLGIMMEECGHHMDDVLRGIFEYKDLDQMAFINTIEGHKHIRKCITRVGLYGTKIGIALWAVYLKFTGRDPQYRGPFRALVDSYDIIPFDSDITYGEKKREFGVVANQLFAGRSEAECLAATAQFALKLLAPQTRWHGPEDGRRPLYNAYGHDDWLFVHPRDEEHNLVTDAEGNIVHGLQHYWLTILAEFTKELDL